MTSSVGVVCTIMGLRTYTSTARYSMLGYCTCTHTVHMALVGYLIVFSIATKCGQTIAFILWGTIVPLNFLVGYHCSIVIIIIIITFLFTQGMPKQLKTGFHWGPACVNIKIEYREYGNPRGNSLPAPQFRGNQVYKLRRSAQENQFLMTVLSRNACIIA